MCHICTLFDEGGGGDLLEVPFLNKGVFIISDHCQSIITLAQGTITRAGHRMWTIHWRTQLADTLDRSSLKNDKYVFFNLRHVVN